MTDILSRNIDGLTALAVVPTIAEDLPAEIREGLARRRLLATGQTCPCGAQPPQLNRRQRREIEARRRRGLPGTVVHVTVLHENDCPASDDALDALASQHGIELRKWI